MTEVIEMLFGGLTYVGQRNRVLHRVEIPLGKGHFWGLSSPLKGIGSLCCGVHSKCDHSIINNGGHVMRLLSKFSDHLLLSL